MVKEKDELGEWRGEIDKLDILDRALKSIPISTPLLLTGDLNCRSSSWEKNKDNSKNTPSWKMGEKMEDDMRQVAEGIMFLIANQMDDLIQIGANVEEGRRREPFNEKGNIIPFPTTPTKH